jgi:hypothetical protein
MAAILHASSALLQLDVARRTTLLAVCLLWTQFGCQRAPRQADAILALLHFRCLTGARLCVSLDLH